MLQVTESFTANPSPCHTCPNLGDKKIYPNCATFHCQPINNYLKSLGILPYKAPQDLARLYPPDLKRSSKNTLVYCTPEQYQEASERLRQIKKATGWTGILLAAKLGITTTTSNSILRGSQKKTTIGNYDRIMGFRV